MRRDSKIVRHKDKYIIFGNEQIELDLDNLINLYNQITDLLIANFNKNNDVIGVIPDGWYMTKEQERLPKYAFALLTKDKLEELHNYMIKASSGEKTYG